MPIEDYFFSENDNPKAKNYSLIRSIKPSGKFQKFGRLYLLSNFIFTDPPSRQEKAEAQEFVEKALVQIEDIYYDPLASTKSIETNFENLLHKMNDWLKRERLRISKPYLENSELCLVLSLDKEIYCSKFGQFVIFLASADKFEFLGPKEENEQGNFANIISGKLSPGDSLFFTQMNLFNYFTEDKIAEFLRNNECFQIHQFIKERLPSLNLNLGGLIIQAKEKPQPAEEPQPREELQPGEEAKEKLTEEKELKEDFPKKKKANLKSYEEELISLAPDKGSQIKQPKKKKKHWFGLLSRVQKIILILIVIALIFLGQNLIVSQKRARLEEQERILNQAVVEFNSKKEEITMAQDKKDIKTALKEMEIILQNFPQNLESEKEKYNQLKEEWLSLVGQYFNYQTLEISPLFDLTNLEENFSSTNLLMIDDYLYLINKTNNHLWQINLLNKEASLLSTTLENKATIDKIISLDKDNLLLFDQEKQIARFNLKTKNYTPLIIELLPSNLEISHIFLYGGRIYILDKQANQIFKYPETIVGFSRGEPWILEEEPRNFANITSFAIDGAIYLLRNDGTIIKFYLGQQKEFNQDDIFPEVETASLLHTHSETNNLYFVDKQTARLIIYNKEGHLIAQYANPVFSDLKSIEEKESVLTILAQEKIYQIKIE